MARKYTVEQYDERIARIDEQIATQQTKIDALKPRLQELKDKRKDLELAKLKQHNSDMIKYLQEHTNQSGKTYYESFTETMEKQRKTGTPAKNTVKAASKK